MNDALLLDARRVLLQGIIDYTGLVPPTPLAIEEAVAAYRAARHHDHAWVLGRFVTPASRLEELTGALSTTMGAGEEPWPISVVLDGDLGRAAARAQAFVAHMGSAAEAVFAERGPRGGTGAGESSRFAGLLATARAMAAISPTITVFLEVPLLETTGNELDGTLADMAAASGAIQRTVGATISCDPAERDEVPSVSEVTRFLTGCRTAGIPFKVTEGLERAIRSHDPDIAADRHGFLNMIVAAGLALDDADQATVAAALSTTDAAAFSVRRSGVAWEGHRLNTRSLRRLRHEWFPAFGSRSFDLPIAHLIEIGVLEE